MESSTNSYSIVVGVDGSDESNRALEWAAAEAKARNGSVTVVSAWYLPAMVYAGGFTPMVTPSVEESTKHASQATAEAAVNELTLEGVQATAEVPYSSAAQALIDASADADLLVVGSRGHGGFSGLLLGSVSAQCAHHAHCPVVIVR